MSKRNMKKIVMAIMTAVVAAGAAASNNIPVFAEPGEESGSRIVADEGENVLDTADIDMLQEELNDLCREVPGISQVPSDVLTRKNSMKSKGTINYNNGTVLIRAADFAYLADEIDMLEYSYKINVMNALNSINTYFATDGTIVHDRDTSDALEESALNLSFDKLYEGILQSQSVEHLASQQIYAAIADNLSLGTAAWVNGKLIIGSGADNDAHYRQGFLDGQLSLYNKASISYVYHVHSDSCYTYREGHQHSASCYEGSTGSWKHSYDCSDDGSGCPGHAYLACGREESSSGYKLTCRKTESTIESATIVFDE